MKPDDLKSTEIIRVGHLLRRTRMGFSFDQWVKYAQLPIPALVDRIFEESAPIRPINLVSNPLMDKEMGMMEMKSMHLGMDSIMVDWLEKLALDPCGLRERMTYFWHGHFCAFSKNPYPIQELNNVLRTHCLGNFRDLLNAVIRTPAIINFLDLNQNSKGKPNENFGRELMELFTMGVGNYSEGDVREVSRAFTGWHSDHFEAQFEFKPEKFDKGEKVIFGKRGNFGGQDVVDMILAQPATARFIVGKMYKEFVNPVVNTARVEALAADFRQHYDLARLMRAILTADWFYAPENMGNMIKSPIELVCGIIGFTQAKLVKTDILIRGLSRCGQLPFHPPSVGGWPSGEYWINSVTLPVRLELPSRMMGKFLKLKKKRSVNDWLTDRWILADHGYVGASVDWEAIASQFQGIPSAELRHAILAWLLAPMPKQNLNALIQGYEAGLLENEKIPFMILAAMGVPEFQIA